MAQLGLNPDPFGSKLGPSWGPYGFKNEEHRWPNPKSSNSPFSPICSCIFRVFLLPMTLRLMQRSQVGTKWLTGASSAQVTPHFRASGSCHKAKGSQVWPYSAFVGSSSHMSGRFTSRSKSNTSHLGALTQPRKSGQWWRQTIRKCRNTNTWTLKIQITK